MTLPVLCRARSVAHPSLSALMEGLAHADPDVPVQLGTAVRLCTLSIPLALAEDPSFQVHAVEVRVGGQVLHWAVVTTREPEAGRLWDLVDICPRRWRLQADPRREWMDVPLRPRSVREPALTAALAPVLMALGLTEDVPRLAGHLRWAA